MQEETRLTSKEMRMIMYQGGREDQGGRVDYGGCKNHNVRLPEINSDVGEMNVTGIAIFRACYQISFRHLKLSNLST